MGAAKHCAEAGARARQVALQVRRSGIWFDLAHFDAGDVEAEVHVRSAVEQLAAVDASTRFRILTRESLPLHLLEYSASSGWEVVNR